MIRRRHATERALSAHAATPCASLLFFWQQDAHLRFDYYRLLDIYFIAGRRPICRHRQSLVSLHLPCQALPLPPLEGNDSTSFAFRLIEDDRIFYQHTRR